MALRVTTVVLFLLLAGGLTGCTSASGSLTPIKAVGNASGDMSGPQVFIGGMPVNALVKVHGQIAYTVQPFPPYLTYDGDYTIIVEPVAGHESEAIAAVTRGDLLIRKNGIPQALHAPGTIAAYKAALMRAYPPPPALPAPTPVLPPSHAMLVDPDACVGDSCSIHHPNR
jgi:hypothetical protein